METPETIRTSLHAGEWVTSLDLKDAYFHIPIHSQSRKYMRFHVQGRSYQFKALPFGQSTAPMAFTVVAKEVKLMALQRGIRIHQYLDDWLVRTTSPVRTGAKTGFQLHKLPVRLEGGQGQTHIRALACLDRQNSDKSVRSGVSGPEFMSLIGLLTATEKQVHLGRLHMRPIQWHLKNNWRVPESLEKVIPVPRSLHPHLKWWLEENNVLPGQPLHLLKHALQIFTDASKSSGNLVGSSGNVQSDPSVSAQPAQSGVSTIQPDPAQEPVKPEPTCLAPRATAIKDQGFSEAVAAQMEAPQRGSTRSVYETKWCLSIRVDFRATPLKAIADFLLHLLQDRKLQPSTIDWYRSAIAYKLGKSPINVSIPSWNLSLVLHQLTKAPFEPLKESSLKHLTFKTVFLLALGSGKRRSEIHAWLHKNIRHQSV